jgi:hypothetical protein
MVQWASLIPLVILIFFGVWHPPEDKKQAEQDAPEQPLPAALFR